MPTTAPTLVDSAKTVIRDLQHLAHWTRVELAARADMDTDKLDERLAPKGRTKLSLADIEAFARAFDIPPWVILLEPPEAIRWVTEHRPTLLEQRWWWIAARPDEPRLPLAWDEPAVIDLRESPDRVLVGNAA